MIRHLFFCLTVLALGACSSQQATAPVAEKAVAEPGTSLGNIEYQTHLLANELFANVRIPRQARYAVAGFVPATTLAHNSGEQRPLMLLGHQLEQGLLTEATKRGFTTQEFKLSDDIILGQDNDRVLSRNIDHLSGLERVDYYITGTLVHQEGGAVVNARIIETRTKQVVAAATRFFPSGLFWQQEQVTLREGRLYRTQNKG